MGRALPFVAAFVCAVSFSSTGSAAPPGGLSTHVLR